MGVRPDNDRYLTYYEYEGEPHSAGVNGVEDGRPTAEAWNLQLGPARADFGALLLGLAIKLLGPEEAARVALENDPAALAEVIALE